MPSPSSFRLLPLLALAAGGSVFQPVSAQVASVPAAPVVISPADPASLRAGILAAAKAGLKKVVVPPGVYALPTSTTTANLELSDLSDLAIEATGATFLMPDSTKGGLWFNRCRNVSLRGATIRNATIPFTQGTVVLIAPDRKSFELQIDAGFPMNMDNTKFFGPSGTWYLFNSATRRLKDGSSDLRSSSVERLAPDRFRVVLARPLDDSAQIGDFSARRGLGSSGLQSNGSQGMTFENVSVQYAGGFGFCEARGPGGNRYSNISVKPGPRPPGATVDALLSENADGFHSSSMGKGPLIENSTFSRMPDDGIAIHGEYAMVRKIEGNSVIAMRLWPTVPYDVGETAHFVSKDGVPLGEAKVTGVKALADNLLPPIESNSPHFRDSHYFFQLTFDKTPPDVLDGFVCNVNRMGNGYILRGNTITDHRARGLLLKARDGLVENNRIDGSSIAGIVLGPELWWGEADYSQNVVIRGNTIAHCGYANTGNWNRQAGALSILGERGAPDARGHTNISIENNIFAANDGVNVVLDGLENAVFRGNRFFDAQQKPNTRGSDFYDTGALIWLGRVKNLSLENNRVGRLGAANTVLVKASPDAGEVTGQTSGVVASATPVR